MENDVMEQYIKKIAESQKITEGITQTDEYINWLESFTVKYPKFFDDDFSKNESERINASKLSNFYEAIKIYAKMNFIYGNSNKLGEEFYIKHNGIGYIIGVLHVYDDVVFVQRLKNGDLETCIDFKDIKENKLTNRAIRIYDIIDSLNENIFAMADEAVPMEAIEKTTKDIMKLVKQNID